MDESLEIVELDDSQLEYVIGGVTTDRSSYGDVETDIICPKCGKQTVYYTPSVKLYTCVRCGAVDINQF